MIAYAFIIILLCIAAGMCYIALGELPTEAWTRPCRWCFWTAIGAIILALGFPGWYFLAQVLP